MSHLRRGEDSKGNELHSRRWQLFFSLPLASEFLSNLSNTVGTNSRIVNMGSPDNPKFYNIINGEKRTAEKFHQATDPRSEQPLWDVPIATTDDLDEAITAATKAFKTWSKSTIAERQEVLIKMAEVIEKNVPELTELLQRETGKSVGKPT